MSVDATAKASCPSCGVISTRFYSRRLQRLRDIPVAGPVEVGWAKRTSSVMSTCARAKHPPRRQPRSPAGPDPPAGSATAGGRRDQIRRAAAEAASSSGVSSQLVQQALDSAAPDAA
jgi:transposase